MRKCVTVVVGSYEGYRHRIGLSDVSVVSDNDSRKVFLRQTDGSLKNIGLASGIAPYFALWPVQNGPVLCGGAAISYSNPQQKVREVFGNVRVDHIFSTKDSLFVAYTVDDSIIVSPGTN